MGISLAALDLTASADRGYEFEYVSEASGMPSGVFITVLGSNSQKVNDWTRKELNKRRLREAMRVKKGKDDVVLVEEDEEFGIHSAVIRVQSWKGIDEPCTPENIERLCRTNVEILNQIMKNSNELGNFIKSN